MKQTYHVRAIWDEEAKVFYCESDIDGLHIETGTIEEFEEVLSDVAPELVLSNHVNPADFATTPLRDFIPTILWQRPELPADA